MARKRLMGVLSAGIDRKLTLVSAPAGFGKSTLVAEWLAGRQSPTAWVSLDEGDSDISSFLSYLVAALQPIAGRGDELIEMARSPRSSPESVMGSLIGSLASVPEEFVLVLDDYHLVDSDAVDEALRYLVNHLPQQMHLVITTREDPQLGLSRLRAKNELAEIRVADLRFGIDEAKLFLNQVMGLDLSPHAVRTLAERTEGWVTGLQLAALSMATVADRERFVESFSGSHRFVLDYLAEDVLDRLPGNIREFLDQTSILDRFSAGLCDAVTGRDDSADVIDYLDRANLFVLPLDTERGWYRYHHLFLDLLRSRITDSEASVTELHAGASDWLWRNDLPLEAFAHAVAAGDTSRAANILEGNGLPLHYRGTFAPVERWLGSLTPKELDESPGLRIACAWVLMTRGAPVGDVDALLDPAEQAVLAMQAGSPRDDLQGQIAAIRALLAIPRGEIEPIIGNAQVALDLLDSRNRQVRSMVAWSLGYVHQQLDEFEAARTAFEQSISEGQESGNRVITIGATISLGQVYARENHLGKATRTFHDALRLTGDTPLPYACEAYLGLARVQYERNELDPAMDNAHRARETGRHLENADTPGMAALLEARIELAQGNREAALAAAEAANEIFRDRGVEHHGTDMADVRAQIHVDGGRLTAAMEMAREYHLTDRLAQVLLLNGDATMALETLGTYIQADDNSGLRTNLTTHIIAAAALWATGETSRATRKMAGILAAVEPEGHVRSFVDVGPAVLAILTGSDLKERYPIYTSTLIAAFGEQPGTDSPAESLSRRELEVLRLIANGLSNREIGERLFIALDTVKGHNRKIYEKLDVSRRTEAVARATDIGLL